MGRKQRIWLPEHFYHIVCRGNQRAPLFKDDGDFLTFLYLLKKIYEIYPFEVASYCLMTNHFHLQLRSQEVPISKIMSLLNKRYANYYNTKNHLTGHVFEKRYYDKIIYSNEGMLEVSKYIHLNPLEAKMVHSLQEYRWSSYPFYYSTIGAKLPFLQVDSILDLYTGTGLEKRKAYLAFVNEQE